MYKKFIFLFLFGILFISGFLNAVESTPARPQLDAKDAGFYSIENVFSKVGAKGSENSVPWNPETDEFIIQGKTVKPDYTVDQKAAQTGKLFKTIQAAVNKACLDAKAKKRTARIYIAVKPGVYNEAVYIPGATDTASATPKAEIEFTVPPITIFGLGADPKETKISFDLNANLWGNEPSKPVDYGRRINPDGKKYTTDNTKTFSGIYKMYSTALGRGKTGIGTGNSPIVWVRNNGFQMKNITVENAYNEDFASGAFTGKQQAEGNHQAVAVEVEGADKAQFENVRMLGNQDTLYIKSITVGTTIRAFLRNCYIEGDVDFIFGRATAFFKKCEIKWLGARNVTTGYCLAPSTNYLTTYGFVFDDCDFTSDGEGLAKTAGVYLGRQWFESIQLSPYGTFEGANAVVFGTKWDPKGTNKPTDIPQFVYEAVGKAIILNSRIGAHINEASPWADWASDPNTKFFRLAQYNSDLYWKYLGDALAKSTANSGVTPETLYPKGKKTPVEPFLAEYNNTKK